MKANPLTVVFAILSGALIVAWTFIPMQVEKPASFSPPRPEPEPIVFVHQYGHGELKVFEVAPICYLAVYERRGKVEGSAEVELEEPEITFSLACR